MNTFQPRRRTFLFLQGLASFFFSRLGAELAARGHGVLRVNLNAGDQLFWRNKGAINFRGRPADWPAFVSALMTERGVTDLVLFGDCRPMHRAAIDAASGLHVSVHVVEEGYIRPDWVTVEPGGVNGHSSLPRDPAWFLDAAASLPPVPEIAPVASSFLRRSAEDVAYNVAGMALCWAFPFFRTHRPWNAAVEYAGWINRLARGGRARRRAEAARPRLEGMPFFLFPLQLDCDSQVRLHSRFKGMRGAIETVLSSFALHAPAGTLLAVKEHPLDNGLVNWRRFTTELAERLGIRDRMVYLEAGDIKPLTEASRGMVTVNSTSGTLGLASGIPVAVLGNAVYDIPGLTFGGTLDQFWSAPTPPDPALFDAFRRVLVQRCLVRGGFFSERGLDMLVSGTVARLEAVRAAPVLSSDLRPADLQPADGTLSGFALPEIAEGIAAATASVPRR